MGDYTHRLAMSLAQDSALQVAVLTSKLAEHWVPDKNVTFLPIVRTWELSESSTVLDEIRRWAPDIVHIQYPTLGYGFKQLPWLLPMLLRLAGFSVVQTWHEIDSLKFLLTSRRLWAFIAKGIVPGGLVVVRSDFQKRTHWLLRWAFLNKSVRFIPNASSIPVVKLSLADRTEVRERYVRPGAHMVTYFGFVYPRKRVDLLFRIIDPDISHLVIVGDTLREEELRHYPQEIRAQFKNYYQSVKKLAEEDRWRGRVTMTGFLPAHEAAQVMAAADAVVVPVLEGGGGWNTSVHAAQAQGTFVLTTSSHRHGYDPVENTYFARENDLDGMKQALNSYLGKRSKNPNSNERAWDMISRSHIELYSSLTSRRIGSLVQRSDRSSGRRG